MERTILSSTVKQLRKKYGLTQADLALKSGVGLCFIRSLEQGKKTLRMDKVNELLDLFNYELVPERKAKNEQLFIEQDFMEDSTTEVEE